MKLSLGSIIAGILCGTSGIAPGNVLAPLFLSFNMIPQVMSGTNQFVGMIATIATSVLYFCNGSLLVGYSSMYGLAALVSTFIGLNAINKYVARSGKQSTISTILAWILTLSTTTLPLKYYLKMRAGL